MPLALAPGISFCECDQRRIFLDLARDRYFCLGEPADQAFGALLRGAAPSDEQVRRLDTLVASGILAHSPFGDLPRPCRARAPGTSLLDAEQQPPANAWQSLAAAAAVARARFALRRLGLARMAAGARRLKEDRPRGERRPPPEQLAAIAAAFRSASQITGARDLCLPRSFAILRHCLAHEIGAEMVIGVKLRPFQAHAWVVCDGALISDPLATITPFTPILTL